MLRHQWTSPVIATLVSLMAATPMQATAAKTEPATCPSGTISAEKLQADLDFMLATMKEAHPNLYAYTAQADADRTFQQVRAAIGQPMTGKEFYRLIAPAVASLKNGHTYVFPPVEEFQACMKGGGKVLPVTFGFDQQKVILRDCSGQKPPPLGVEVLSINGQDAMAICQRYASYFPAEGNTKNMALIERGEILRILLWMDYGCDTPLALKVKDTDRKISEFSVQPTPADGLKPGQAATTKSGRWQYKYLPGARCGVITFDGFDLAGFDQFLKDAFGDIRAKKAESLIIDLRACPGGDGRVGDALMNYLTEKPFIQFQKTEIKVTRQMFGKYAQQFGCTENQIGSVVALDGQATRSGQPVENSLRFRGRVIVLIGPRSTSASTSFAACVKYYHLGTLIGEETGDTTDLYADSYVFTLPNSQIKVSVACKHFVLAGGKPDGRGVIPDQEVKQTREDLSTGKDTVLDYVLEMLRKSPPKGTKGH